MKSKIDVKIFVGIEANGEVRMHLGSSPLWKDHQLLASHDPCILREIPYEGKNYVGRFLAYSEVTLKDFEGEVDLILKKLHEYSPLLKVDKNNTIVFPQVFVT